MYTLFHNYVFMYVQLLPAIMKDFSDVARGIVSNEELTRAKSVNVVGCVVFQKCCVIFLFDYFVFVILYRNQLKASYLMSTETQSGLVEDIASQVSDYKDHLFFHTS